MKCYKCNHLHYCGKHHRKLAECSECTIRVWLCKDNSACNKDGDNHEDDFHCHDCYQKDIQAFKCDICIYKSTEKM